MGERIPDEIMAEAARVWTAMGFVNDRLNQAPILARALMARDERAARIAQECLLTLHLAPGMADGASMASRQIATAILTYDSAILRAMQKEER